MNVALIAAVVALVAVTAALGTCVALRALPEEMPPDLHRLARRCGSALGVGLGAVLVTSVLVQVAGYTAGRVVLIDLVLAVSLVLMVAGHAMLSRWIRIRWVMTPGSELPRASTAGGWMRRLRRPGRRTDV